MTVAKNSVVFIFVSFLINVNVSGASPQIFECFTDNENNRKIYLPDDRNIRGFEFSVNMKASLEDRNILEVYFLNKSYKIKVNKQGTTVKCDDCQPDMIETTPVTIPRIVITYSVESLSFNLVGSSETMDANTVQNTWQNYVRYDLEECKLQSVNQCTACTVRNNHGQDHVIQCALKCAENWQKSHETIPDCTDIGDLFECYTDNDNDRKIYLPDDRSSFKFEFSVNIQELSEDRNILEVYFLNKLYKIKVNKQGTTVKLKCNDCHPHMIETNSATIPRIVITYGDEGLSFSLLSSSKIMDANTVQNTWQNYVRYDLNQCELQSVTQCTASAVPNNGQPSVIKCALNCSKLPDGYGNSCTNCIHPVPHCTDNEDNSNTFTTRPVDSSDVGTSKNDVISTKPLEQYSASNADDIDKTEFSTTIISTKANDALTTVNPAASSIVDATDWSELTLPSESLATTHLQNLNWTVSVTDDQSLVTTHYQQHTRNATWTEMTSNTTEGNDQSLQQQQGQSTGGNEDKQPGMTGTSSIDEGHIREEHDAKEHGITWDSSVILLFCLAVSVVTTFVVGCLYAFQGLISKPIKTNRVLPDQTIENVPMKVW